MEILDQKGRTELKLVLAKDYSRSERYIREVTSRIDKDLKAELRETAFNMWMACYSQEEIAEAVGYGQPAVNKFVKNLQLIKNGTGTDSDLSSENPALTGTEDREFDEDEAKQWAIGDWLVDGMHHFWEQHGKKKKHTGTGLYEEAEKILEIPKNTLMHLKSISETFELLNRFNNLTWTHHAEVASFKTVEIVPDKKLPQGRM